ncbi:MAG: hypothetical protein NTV58_06675 [Deltaproteobacteria bacterium]|nr:hypothetical protein [Deltaproteobacteria bacterium]
MAISAQEKELAAKEKAAQLGTGTKHEAAKVSVYGNADPKVSPFLKAWIAQPDDKSKISVLVVGLIGQGTSRSLQANWNSPFEQSNLGGMFEKAGGLLQATTEKTSVTTLSSTQIWEGNRPNTFNLTLSFYAINDAFREVMEPLRELEKMMGPDISAGKEGDGAIKEFLANAKPLGRIPLPVILNIGRRMMIPNCVIESMSVPLDKERTKEGYLVRADVTLSISTKVMLNKENIAKTWG